MRALGGGLNLRLDNNNTFGFKLQHGRKKPYGAFCRDYRFSTIYRTVQNIPFNVRQRCKVGHKQ